MTLKKWGAEGVDYAELNENFNSSLKSAHLARIDQLRLMQNVSMTERADDLDLIRDVFTDADGYNNTVDTALGAYDTTNDYYSIPLFWVEIEATSISGTGDFAINDCQIVNFATGKWILTAGGASLEVQRAKVYKTLFYGTDGSNPRATATYITGITALRSSRADDVGKRAYYATGSNSSDFTYQGTFADTTNNTDCSSWSNVYMTPAGNYTRWELPSGTTLNTTTGTSEEIGTDRSADEYDNPATCEIECNSGNGGSGKIILLCVGSVSWAKTVGGGGTVVSNTDFFTTHSVPLITAATITNFYVRTSAFSLDSHSTDNIDSIFITAQKEDDGTNLITYDVSSDNGNTWTEDLSFDTINEITSTQGTQLIIKFNLPNDADAKLYGYSGAIGRDV